MGVVLNRWGVSEKLPETICATTWQSLPLKATKTEENRAEERREARGPSSVVPANLSDPFTLFILLSVQQIIIKDLPRPGFFASFGNK